MRDPAETTEPVTANINGKEKLIKTSSEKAFEKAVEAYKKLLKTNSDDDAAQFNLGRTYAKLNKDEEAEEAFKEAVKLKPDDTEYQTELGAIRIKLAKYSEAIDPLKKAIALDESNSRAADLLEDAEAGRQRLSYVPKNTNAMNANTMANTTANANSNSASNSNSHVTVKPGKTPEANTKTKKDDPKSRPRPRIRRTKLFAAVIFPMESKLPLPALASIRSPLAHLSAFAVPRSAFAVP